MGVGGGGGGARGLEEIEQLLIAEQINQAQSAGNREQFLFNELTNSAGQLNQAGQGLSRELNSTAQALQNQGANLLGEASSRTATERALLLPRTNIGDRVAGLGQRFGDTSRAGANSLRSLTGDFLDFSVANTLGNLSGQNVAGQLNTLANVGNLSSFSNQAGNLGGASGIVPAGQIQQAGQGITGLSNQVGQDLGQLRNLSLANLEDAARGQVPGAVSSLVRDSPGAARERDVLELQFQNAQNQLTENAAGRTGNLSRNQAALQTQRALGIAGQESRRADIERDVSLGLLNQAQQQGLTAPQQQAGLLGQGAGVFGAGGQLQLGAEGARQNALGLGGQLQSQIGQQILGAEGARQGAIGQSAGILSNAQTQRLAGLQAATGNLNTALGRDLQGLSAQQQSLVQQQQLIQSLAGQLGEGADQLRLAAPGLFGQSAALRQGAATAPILGSQLLQGIPVSSPGTFLGSAGGIAQGALGRDQQAAIANQQGKGQLLGTGAGLAGAALIT